MIRIWRKGVLALALWLSAGCAKAETIEDWRIQQGKQISLPDLIELICDHEVHDWDETLAPTFKQVAADVLSKVKAKPIQAKRINEVGNAVELHVMDALKAAGLETGRPTPPSGRKKTSGYPDLYAISKDDFFYIEIKTYSPKTVKSTQRTFYISPSDDFKVTKDGFHLLLAFSTEQIEEGLYSLTGFKLLDLFELECRLKMEFNASNKDLYDSDARLIVAEEG